MNISRAISRPYPVVSHLNDDVAPNAFEFELETDSDSTSWFLKFAIHHGIPSLNEYIAGKDATYAIHLECSRTFHRSIHRFDSPEGAFAIDGTQLRGKVEVCAFVIAENEISSYKVSGQHEDYGGRTFRIEPGEILAASKSLKFDAFLDYDPIREVSSILNIEPNEDDTVGNMELYFGGQRLTLFLSKNDFDSYKQLRSDPALHGLLISNVVFPAISEGLHYLRELNEESLEDEKCNCLWVRSVVKRLHELHLDLHGEEDRSFEFAQILLKNPLRRGLIDMGQLFE